MWANTLIDGDCSFNPPEERPGVQVSNGYNIESTGDTCGFDQSTDMPGMSADDLKLGELADNGGPTMTHALPDLNLITMSEALDAARRIDDHRAAKTAARRITARLMVEFEEAFGATACRALIEVDLRTGGAEPRTLALSLAPRAGGGCVLTLRAAAEQNAEIIDALEMAFREHGQGNVEVPPKPGVHSRPDAFIHAMPAYIPSTEAAGMKWVSGYPENQSKGLPYITGLLILNDADTGLPIAVMDATWITAKRTGAATAVAAKYLARPRSSSVGILACGVQGRTNLEALATLFPITTVKAYDIYPEVAQTFAAEMAKITPAEIEVVQQPREAVEGMDLVVTSGPILKNPTPTIEAGWLKAGGFFWGDSFYFTAGCFHSVISQKSIYLPIHYHAYP